VRRKHTRDSQTSPILQTTKSHISQRVSQTRYKDTVRSFITWQKIGNNRATHTMVSNVLASLKKSRKSSVRTTWAGAQFLRNFLPFSVSFVRFNVPSLSTHCNKHIFTQMNFWTKVPIYIWPLILCSILRPTDVHTGSQQILLYKDSGKVLW
jgi:hypothetical protein